MKRYKIIGRFVDKNQPDLIYRENTEPAAVNRMAILSDNFAGLKCIFIDTPNNSRHVYTPDGNYQFTVPHN